MITECFIVLSKKIQRWDRVYMFFSSDSSQFLVITILMVVSIHTYTVLLLWIGHAPFHEHTNEKPLVVYLELNILPK